MSSDQCAIRVRDLSKCYQIYDRPQDRLKQSIYPRLQRILGREPKNCYREFWALKDVSFEVMKGEAVGIVGRNGAGKSTLLQLICGTLNPSTGSIEVEGSVAALLELGSGFNPEFSGRENVYLNASVLGLNREAIDQKFDEIAAFADIGDFLEQPIKIYSSGMLMRLAFAVNACLDPKILIVDEALSVGDAPFQSKCFKRLRQLIDDGTSVLFVSHDISTVRSICHRVLWLKDGRAEKWGEAKDVAKEYERFCWREEGVVLQNRSPNDAEAFEIYDADTFELPKWQSNGRKDSSSVLGLLLSPNPIFETHCHRSREGTGDVVIKNFLILDREGHLVSSCDYDEELSFYYLLDVCRPVNSDFVVGIWFRDLRGNSVYSANDLNTIHKLKAEAGEKYFLSAKLRVPLSHQDYEIHTSIFGFREGTALAGHVYDFSRAIVWDMTDSAAYLTVRPHKVMPVAGPVGASFNLQICRI